MSDLSIQPVYLSARAAIVAPERAIPLTLYATQRWLPRLGPERWCLVMLLRSLSIDAPRRSNGTKRVTCSWRELAEMLDVHEETVASWLKHEPIPQDKPWRRIIGADEKTHYLSLFIPRLRYAYETSNNKTRRVGFLLEILMEDPVVPEDEARLQQQVELLRMQQGELGLTTYRLADEVNSIQPDSAKTGLGLAKPSKADLPYVNQFKPELPLQANPFQPSLLAGPVKPDFTDLPPSVKQHNADLDSYVNLEQASLRADESEESLKNVNELDSLIQQLKQNNVRKNLRKPTFEPVIRLTEELLDDNHSEAMLYKVLNVLYPERVDLYVAAVRVAVDTALNDPQVNRGAVFVRVLREFAEVAGVDLGLKRTGDKEPGPRPVMEPLGTRVPERMPDLPAPLAVDEKEAIWAETQSELRRQMTRATYEAIIQGTSLVKRDNSRYIVGVQSEMAKEWLENRLRDVVQRTLANVVGGPVTVEFTLVSLTR